MRAQRQAWEARRKTAREDFNARRRLNNPRGSARQDAWEADLQRRRAARQQHIEQERELFGIPDGRPSLLPFKRGETARDHNTPAPAEGPLPQPPGWNNRWYFQGY